jgi:hypothetical protein
VVEADAPPTGHGLLDMVATVRPIHLQRPPLTPLALGDHAGAPGGASGAAAEIQDGVVVGALDEALDEDVVGGNNRELTFHA